MRECGVRWKTLGEVKWRGARLAKIIQMYKDGAKAVQKRPKSLRKDGTCLLLRSSLAIIRVDKKQCYLVQQKIRAGVKMSP